MTNSPDEPEYPLVGCPKTIVQVRIRLGEGDFLVEEILRELCPSSRRPGEVVWYNGYEYPLGYNGQVRSIYLHPNIDDTVYTKVIRHARRYGLEAGG